MSKQKREIKVQKEYGKSTFENDGQQTKKKKSFLRPRCKISVKNH